MEFMRKRREKRDELAQMAVDQNEGREGQNERDIGFVLGETITSGDSIPLKTTHLSHRKWHGSLRIYP